MEIKAKLVKDGTRLKCRECKIFYPDDGSIIACEKCLRLLKRITVHGLNPKKIIVKPKKVKVIPKTKPK